uniref:Uncharacterized protein n=1 Tax=Helianthus annuus TaxID=4232 RepID=A0A251SF70_HELAN
MCHNMCSVWLVHVVLQLIKLFIEFIKNLLPCSIWLPPCVSIGFEFRYVATRYIQKGNGIEHVS